MGEDLGSPQPRAQGNDRPPQGLVTRSLEEFRVFIL